MDSAIPMPDQQARPRQQCHPRPAMRGAAPSRLPFAPPAGLIAPARPDLVPAERAAGAARAVQPACRREAEYTALSLLLAIPGFVFVVVAITVGLGLSLSFAGMLVGLPLLTVSLLGARKLGAVNRALAGRMLGQQVAPPPPPRRQPGAVGWIRAGLTDPAGWRACAYLLLKLPLAVITAIIASGCWCTGSRT